MISRFLIFLFTIGFFYGCTDEATVAQNELEGKWLMTQAYRDNEATETLKDAFLDFKNDSILVSNLNKREKSYTYRLEGNTISQKGPMEVNYNIEKFQGDTLILSSMIRSYAFRFELMRDTSSIVEVDN